MLASSIGWLKVSRQLSFQKDCGQLSYTQDSLYGRSNGSLEHMEGDNTEYVFVCISNVGIWLELGVELMHLVLVVMLCSDLISSTWTQTFSNV